MSTIKENQSFESSLDLQKINLKRDMTKKLVSIFHWVQTIYHVKMDKVDTCIDHNYTDKRKSFERLTQWFSTVFYLRHTIFMDKVLQHTIV